MCCHRFTSHQQNVWFCQTMCLHGGCWKHVLRQKCHLKVLKFCVLDAASIEKRVNKLLESTATRNDQFWYEVDTEVKFITTKIDSTQKQKTALEMMVKTYEQQGDAKSASKLLSFLLCSVCNFPVLCYFPVSHDALTTPLANVKKQVQDYDADITKLTELRDRLNTECTKAGHVPKPGDLRFLSQFSLTIHSPQWEKWKLCSTMQPQMTLNWEWRLETYSRCWMIPMQIGGRVNSMEREASFPRNTLNFFLSGLLLALLQVQFLFLSRSRDILCRKQTDQSESSLWLLCHWRYWAQSQTRFLVIEKTSIS